MGLRIKSLTAAAFATTSRDPLATSLHAGMVEQRFMTVRLETGDGTLGFGEAAATPFITGETLETMLAVVRGEIAPLLKGHDIRDVQGMHRRLDRLFPAGNRSAISAVDMAVHDALGTALGVPVSAGVGCQIGTLSTSIGSAAAIHLIHAHPVISLPEVTWPDRLVRNPASGFAVKNGRASIPEAPGIGLMVEDSMRTGHEFI
ncbi:hypothetical protein [Rhizobium binxianense]